MFFRNAIITCTRRSYRHIEIAANASLRTVTFNRPHKYNAIHGDMYMEIADALNNLAEDSTCSVVALTGKGKFYSSGNDISNFTQVYNEENGIENARKTLDTFVSAFIDFPKPLVALCNGPAIGIAVTTLSLCDMVWASDSAYFMCPFTRIAQSPEGCSSYTFPNIMGPSMASEMLLCNTPLSAEDAKHAGLVSAIYPSDKFVEITSKRVMELSQLPTGSMRLAKSLIRNEEEIKKLKQICFAETKALETRWTTIECQKAVETFFAGQTKK